MANSTILGLTTLSGTAASGDYLALWDTSGSVTRKVTLTTIQAVLLAQANTFTAGQTIATTSASDSALVSNMVASNTGYALRAYYNSESDGRFNLIMRSTIRAMQITAWDNTTSFGSYLALQRNNNATTPAAGFLILDNKAGTPYHIWVDASVNVRVGSSVPTNANDTTGTVIGTQTSMAEAKNLMGDVGDPMEALRAIVDAAHNGLQRFNYKSGSFGGQEFEGIVTDYAPRYGMDRDVDHPAGKSLNEIQLFGDLIRAVALLAEKMGVEL